MSQQSPRKAVVLVSGGMDSAVTIAIAREQGYQVHALSVAYGQRHSAELEASERVSRALGAVEHKTVACRPAQHRRFGADRRYRCPAGSDR